jgi:LacI family transcriptional regulator
MPSTIRDVAKRLHLSITTVSRALDGYGDVAPGTRQLVVKTAKKMGYVPNRAARQLRRQRTDTVGYILPAESTGFTDLFFSEFIAGLSDKLADHHYDLLVAAAPPDSQAEKELYERWIQGGKVDGIIVNRVRLSDWRLHFLSRQHVPHVSLERSLSQLDFVGIEVDSFGGLQELMGYLVHQGHRRIAYIGGGSDLKIEHDRFAGYQAGLKSAGLGFDPALVERSDMTSEGGYRAARLLFDLANRPTAIACINDLAAMGAMHAAHMRGLITGRDIAIAGFDGLAEAAHTQPPLTTLEQPVYSVARQLTQMLLTVIAGEALEETAVKIQPQLIIRPSTSGQS